jgi:hypothetical protein
MLLIDCFLSYPRYSTCPLALSTLLVTGGEGVVLRRGPRCALYARDAGVGGLSSLSASVLSLGVAPPPQPSQPQPHSLSPWLCATPGEGATGLEKALENGIHAGRRERGDEPNATGRRTSSVGIHTHLAHTYYA